MSEIVRRIAVAIDTTLGGLIDDDDGRLSSEIRERINQAARAVLEAMREPTDEMVDACDININIPTEGMIIGVWTDMIDVALREKVDA